jgi:hypothetical protein
MSWRWDAVTGLVAQMGTFCVPAGASADLKFDGELPGRVAAMYASFAMPPGLPKWTAALPSPGLHFMTRTRGRCVGGPARELRDWPSAWAGARSGGISRIVPPGAHVRTVAVDGG